MTTISEHVHGSTIGAGRRRWTTLLGQLEHISLWLVVAAYAVVYTGLLVGAASAALYLGAVLPGLVGVAVFFTVGLALIAAAPMATRALFTHILDARDARRTTADNSGGEPVRTTQR